MSNALAVLMFLILNIADVLSTKIGLRAGIQEGNPLPAGILEAHGEWAMYGVKWAVILLTLAALVLLTRRYPILWRVVYVWDVMFVLVVANNVALVVTR